VGENIGITFDAKCLSTFPFLHLTLSFHRHLEDAGSLNLSGIFSIPTTVNLTLVLVTKLDIFCTTFVLTHNLFIYLFIYLSTPRITTSTKLTNIDPSLQLEMVKPVEATKVIGLTGTYLYEVLKKRLKVTLFDDVYSADKVPLGRLSDTSSRQSRVCIVNCSTSLQPGSHFVALLIQADDILVLDSLALALSKVSPVLEKETAQIQEEN
jgi:hypothetical protein